MNRLVSPRQERKEKMDGNSMNLILAAGKERGFLIRPIRLTG
jgi:hypothetical protein